MGQKDPRKSEAGERDVIKITTDILPQNLPRGNLTERKLVFGSTCLMTVERGTGQWRVTSRALEMVRAWDTAGQRGREVAMETDCDSVTRTRRPMGQRRRREADIHKDPSFRLRPLGEYITNGANK